MLPSKDCQLGRNELEFFISTACDYKGELFDFSLLRFVVHSSSPKVPDVVNRIVKSAIFDSLDQENQQNIENLDHLIAKDCANFHTASGAGSTSTVDGIQSEVVTVETFITMIEDVILGSEVPSAERDSIDKFSVAA